MGILCCMTDTLWKCIPLIPIIGIAIISYFMNPKKKSIRGKHVMITGGSSGIGLSFAESAIREGAKITLVARNVQKLQKAQSDLEKIIANESIDSKVQYFSVDLSKDECKVHEMVREAEILLGPIFMLVNCAGNSISAKFEDISQHDIINMMNTNFTGSFVITQEVVRSMKRTGDKDGGIIMFTSSQAGLFGLYGYTAYAACKGALVKMAEALHMELKPYNISVTVSYPPDTDTPGFAEENKSKPSETSLISASAGLFKADEVANKMMSDALSGKFHSTVGLEGFMLTTLCAGMSPITHISDFFYQVFLSGVFRSVSAFYLWSFDKIVRQEHQKRHNSKKRE